MDMKRYEKIDGHEALRMLLQDKHVFNTDGMKTYIQNSKLVRDFTGMKAMHSELTVEEFLERTWYVKKPFDVRAEMLARPNEWVGAFEDAHGCWHKAGFSIELMAAMETSNWNNENVKDGIDMWKHQLEKCIPIEDVPKEELK